MTIALRRLAPDDWPVWREVRLRALAESPAAFGSTLAREQGFAEADWRERMAIPAFAAFVDGVPVGIGAGLPEDETGDLMVVAMWTDPVWRGRGVGGRVLDAVVATAVERGLGVRLFVMRDNPDVARLYERHGFRRTGLVEEHDGRPADEMRLGFQAEP